MCLSGYINIIVHRLSTFFVDKEKMLEITGRFTRGAAGLMKFILIFWPDSTVDPVHQMQRP